jgi:parvulin-like peptidyl-prolyl isomerase
MSITAMKKRFVSRFGKWVLYGLALIFIITLPFMFSGTGGGMLSDRGQTGEGGRAGANDPMAKVNGETLTREEFDRAYAQGLGQMQAIYAQVGGTIGVERLWTFRLESLDQAINDELLRQEAKTRGIKVGGREVDKRVDDEVENTVKFFQTQYKGQNLEQIYAAYVSSKDNVPRERMTERQFRKWVKDMLKAVDLPRIEMEILTEKLKKEIAPTQPVGDAELLASYDSITPRQIVVSLQPRGKPARTQEEAKQRAEELLAQVRGGADFATLAKQESEDEEAKITGGLQAEPKQVRSMDPEWMKKVGPLKVGEVSEPIETPYAYLIVKVEKRDRELPPDFEKNKAKERETLQGQRQSQAWERWAKALRAKAKIDNMVDAEMKGYLLLREGKVDEGLAALKEAAKDPERLGPAGASSVNFQLATYLASQNKWKEAAEYYAYADDYLQSQATDLPGARVQTLMGMGRSYENLSQQYKQEGKTKEAQSALEESLSWYQVASEQSELPSYHEQLQQIFRNLGQAELVQQEQDWLDTYHKAEAEKAKAYEAQQREMEKGAGKPRRPLGPAPAPSQP